MQLNRSQFYVVMSGDFSSSTTFLTKIDTHNSLSLKTTHSTDYHNYLSTVVENELTGDSPNTVKLWIKMGEELEMEQDILPSQISTIIRKDIEDKLFEKQKDTPREECRYHSGYFFRIMKCQGWTNPEMARNSNNDVDPLGDQQIVPCANPDMKAVCYDVINLCRILIDKSKDCKPFEDVFGEKQMIEFYKQRHTIINNCKNAIDNKTKVPRNTEIFLLECMATILGSVNKCAETFMEQNLIHLKKQLIISTVTGKPVPFLTTKQATKFQKGMKQSQQIILKPTSRDQALFLDYTGVQCECGSFRVRQKLDSYSLECYECGASLPPGHISKCTHCKIPLYKERLLHIVKTSKCENCNDTVDLPQVLIDYAKS